MLEEHFNSFFKSDTTVSPIFININTWNKYTCQQKIKEMMNCFKIYKSRLNSIPNVDYFYGIQRHIVYYIPYIKYYTRFLETKYFQKINYPY